MSRLDGKVIVVTGGSGLLGREIIFDINQNGGIALNLDINVDASISTNFKCDITSSISIRRSIDKILNIYNKIDGWVNNAYPRTRDWGDKFEKINEKSWEKNIDIQLNSVFKCCQAVLKIMNKQKNGCIINISSIYGALAPDFSIYDNTEMTMPAAYSVIKAGVNNFTRYLASYYGASGIRVNCISPGGIFDNQNKKFVDNYIKKVPLGKMAAPKDIAPSVSFLLSDKAKYISGHNLIIDGGWSII